MGKISLHQMKCPNCGAYVEEVPASSSYRCGYCRATFLVDRPEEAVPPREEAKPKPGRPTPERASELAAAGVKAHLDKRYADAVRDLALAVTGRPAGYKLEELYTILGNARTELGQYELAKADHRKAIEINAKYHKAWVNLGVTCRLSGDLDEAEKCYGKAIQIKPDYAELHASLGALHIFRGESKKAIESCRRAVKLDPQLAIAHGNIALAFAMDGQFDMAEKALRQATVLGYASADVVRKRIDELKKLGGKRG